MISEYIWDGVKYKVYSHFKLKSCWKLFSNNFLLLTEQFVLHGETFSFSGVKTVIFYIILWCIIKGLYK